MEILGVGWQEFIFILIIALIVLGPKDMQKAGRTIGRWLNQLVTSDSWKVFQKTSSELRNLPRNLMREANMEMMETEKEIRRAIDPRPNAPASRYSPPSKKTENVGQDEPPADNANAPAADSREASPRDGGESSASPKGSEVADDADSQTKQNA